MAASRLVVFLFCLGVTNVSCCLWSVVSSDFEVAQLFPVYFCSVYHGSPDLCDL